MTWQFVLVIVLLNIGLGQELKVIAKVDSNDRKYLEYLRGDDVTAASFAIDSTTIYIGSQKLFENYNTYMWKYGLPFSESNPKQIKDFKGIDIKRTNNGLTNAGLEILNLKTMTKVFAQPKSNKYTIVYSIDVAYNVRHTYYDSTLWYFWLSGYRYRNLEFFKFDLRDKVTEKVPLSGYIYTVNIEYGKLEDIFVFNHKLYSLVYLYDQLSDRSYYKLLLWDILNDQKIAEFDFPENLYDPKIVGSDITDKIYVFSGSDKFDYSLNIFSPNLGLIESIDMKYAVMKLPFMKENSFLNSDSGGEHFIICTFNDKKELYLMVKTVKGLYFIKYN